MPRLARKVVGQSSFYAAVVTLVVFAAFPFYWMLITTFKTDGDLYSLKSIPYWFNAPPTLEHLKYLFEDTLFVQWLSNSALIGLCVVAITLLVALPAGYGLARMPGRSGENLSIGIFLTYLVPPTLLFLPLSVPAILTVVIFAFTLTVQEFVYALTFISSSSQKPVTLGVATDLIRGDIFYWGELMGAALISSVPVAIAYNLFLDRFISGITGGAVK